MFYIKGPSYAVSVNIAVIGPIRGGHRRKRLHKRLHKRRGRCARCPWSGRHLVRRKRLPIQIDPHRVRFARVRPYTSPYHLPHDSADSRRLPWLFILHLKSQWGWPRPIKWTPSPPPCRTAGSNPPRSSVIYTGTPIIRYTYTSR